MGKNISKTVKNHVLEVIITLNRVNDRIHGMESGGEFELMKELSHRADVAIGNKAEVLRELSQAINMMKKIQEIIAER